MTRVESDSIRPVFGLRLTRLREMEYKSAILILIVLESCVSESCSTSIENTLPGKSMKGSKKATFIRTIAAWRAAGDIGTNMPPKLPPEL